MKKNNIKQCLGKLIKSEIRKQSEIYDSAYFY